MEAGLHEVWAGLNSAGAVLRRLVSLTSVRASPHLGELQREWLTHDKLWIEYNSISQLDPNYLAARARLVAETFIWTTRMLDWTQKLN